MWYAFFVDDHIVPNPRNRNLVNVRPKRILHRIILPFTVLFVIITFLSWLSSAYLITRSLDQSLSRQMERLATTVMRSSYVMNPAVLRQLKGLISAEIVVFEPQGRIISTTFPDNEVDHLTQEVLLSDGELALSNRRYRVSSYPIILPDHGRAFISLWLPTKDADDFKRHALFFLGGIALVGILGMGAIGYLIARSITAPVEKLAEVAEKISEGDLHERAQLDGATEIAGLAAAFNRMIERLKGFEEKLIESEKMATAGQMAAGLAHEIRNPLTSIKMLGQVLKARLGSHTENQRMLESMVKEIDRLDRIIQEMLNRTRPGELNREWVDINAQVDDVIRIVSEKLSPKEIVMESRLSEDLPKSCVDPEKLKQVMWNLILNAEEAMPKGGTLTVSTKVRDRRFIEILVEDTGIGIPEANAARLFEPFFTTKPEGVGLGLTMSQKIVAKHGGMLTLESRPEGGAKAKILLPIKGE
jgi:signal transduction histidine kinase